jgi:hypothetical protein
MWNLNISGRKNRTIAGQTLILIFLNLSCCDYDDNPNPDYEISVVNIITAGSWEVDSYVKGNTSYSNEFSSYLFRFEPDGDMLANTGGIQKKGSWIWNGSDDRLTFTFEVSELPLTDLGKEWNVLSKTGLELYMVTPSGLETLHLKKQ